MNDCKILTFNSVNLKSRLLKTMPGSNPSYSVQMKDYPGIEQEINAYLKAGYKVQNISYTPNEIMTFILTR